MFAQARNTLARATLRYNKQKQLYRLLVAFNVTERDKNGNYRFPVQQKCNYVSGDFPYASLQADLGRTLEQARKLLRTDNIEIVN